MKTIRIVTTSIAAFILVALLLILLVKWNSIPDTVATHFDFTGEANIYSEKSNLLIVPLVAFLLCALLSVVECFPKIWNIPVRLTDENRERIWKDCLLLTGTIKIILSAIFFYICLSSAFSISLSWPIYVLLGSIVLATGMGILKIVKDR